MKKFNWHEWNAKLVQEPIKLENLIKNFNIIGLEIIDIKTSSVLYDNPYLSNNVEIDQPFVIVLSDGRYLEIDYSEASSIKIGIDSLPKDLIYNNCEIAVIFKNAIHQKIIDVKVQTNNEEPLDFTGSHGIEEPKYAPYIDSLLLVLSNQSAIRFTNLYDYGEVSLIEI